MCKNSVQEEALARNTALCSSLAPAPGTVRVSEGHNKFTRPHASVWKEQVRQLFCLGERALWLFGAGEDQGQKSRKTFTAGHPHVREGAGKDHAFIQHLPEVE